MTHLRDLLQKGDTSCGPFLKMSDPAASMLSFSFIT